MVKLWVRVIIFFTTVVSLIGLTYKYKNYRSNLFRYDVEKDYVYDFSSANTEKISLQNNLVKLPLYKDSDLTVFLKVNLQSNFLGRWSSPSIILKSKNLEKEEFFEDGLDGIRFLNISEFVNNGTDTLRIVGKKMLIEDQTAELVSFKNPNLSKASILVIAPHPDDAEIAAYGLYSTFKNSFVLTIKSGESGPFKYNEIYTDSIKHYRKKGQLRTWNSITVPLLAGISKDSIMNLGYFTELDKMFIHKPKNLTSIFAKTKTIETYRSQNISSLKDSLVEGENWNSLVENLKIIIEQTQPDFIVTPYPALDRHMDHKYTTIGVISALKRLEYFTGKLLLYSNHYVVNERYPYGKLGGSITLPPNFNKDLYFESIYSHHLDEATMYDKLFALEAMHDLRQDTEWILGKNLIKSAFQTKKTMWLNGDGSYFQRAVRTNEIFFTVPMSSLKNDDYLQKLIYGADTEQSVRNLF